MQKVYGIQSQTTQTMPLTRSRRLNPAATARWPIYFMPSLLLLCSDRIEMLSSVQKAESPKGYLMCCGAINIVCSNVCFLFVGNLFESLVSPPNLNNNIFVDAEVAAFQSTYMD